MCVYLNLKIRDKLSSILFHMILMHQVACCSVPMDEEEQVVLDYTSDPLLVDGNFQHSVLSSIARAGSAIEELYGTPQDIEGVVKDGKIYVVQTRPQM